MSQLTLDYDQGNSLVRHLDSVSMAKLVRREAAANAGAGGCGVGGMVAVGVRGCRGHRGAPAEGGFHRDTLLAAKPAGLPR